MTIVPPKITHSSPFACITLYTSVATSPHHWLPSPAAHSSPLATSSPFSQLPTCMPCLLEQTPYTYCPHQQLQIRPVPTYASATPRLPPMQVYWPCIQRPPCFFLPRASKPRRHHCTPALLHLEPHPYSIKPAHLHPIIPRPTPTFSTH